MPGFIILPDASTIPRSSLAGPDGVTKQFLVSSRTVSAANTAQIVTLDGYDISDVLAIHMVASAGTATLTVDVSVDNTNFLTLDSIAAAASTVKQYNNTTVGAAIALTPLAFRYIRVTAGTAGGGNTTTLTISAD